MIANLGHLATYDPCERVLEPSGAVGQPKFLVAMANTNLAWRAARNRNESGSSTDTMGVGALTIETPIGTDRRAALLAAFKAKYNQNTP